jgi:hypothetical protein
MAISDGKTFSRNVTLRRPITPGVSEDSGLTVEAESLYYKGEPICLLCSQFLLE